VWGVAAWEGAGACGAVVGWEIGLNVIVEAEALVVEGAEAEGAVRAATEAWGAAGWGEVDGVAFVLAEVMLVAEGTCEDGGAAEADGWGLRLFHEEYCEISQGKNQGKFP